MRTKNRCFISPWRCSQFFPFTANQNSTGISIEPKKSPVSFIFGMIGWFAICALIYALWETEHFEPLRIYLVIAFLLLATGAISLVVWEWRVERMRGQLLSFNIESQEMSLPRLGLKLSRDEIRCLVLVERGKYRGLTQMQLETKDGTTRLLATAMGKCALLKLAHAVQSISGIPLEESMHGQTVHLEDRP